MLNFLIEHWFDCAITVLFLLVEWYNKRGYTKAENEMNAKLDKIKNELEFTSQLMYHKEADKYQEEE